MSVRLWDSCAGRQGMTGTIKDTGVMEGQDYGDKGDRVDKGGRKT